MNRIHCILAILICLSGGKVFSQSPDSLKLSAIATVEEKQVLIEEMSQKLWHYSEVALRESRSASLLAGQLREAGFTLEAGVADMPTAFVATYGSGSPVIGILAEYDALPGVGNQAEPEKVPREDKVTSGHGCGHNLFGAASVGAALALSRVLDSAGISGTIKLFGTPAEETLVGKVYMAKAGVFDSLDAVLEWHPGTVTEVGNESTLAMNNFEVEFFGQAAHGAADPWNGRSALDAVEIMNYGVNLMREHIKPSTRIHYVIPNAGEAPNVVPEYARVWYYVRDLDRENVENYYNWILDIARAAAIATRTEHKVKLITGVHRYLLNRPLIEAIQANLELVGPPRFSPEEQEFGRELQLFVQKDPVGFIDTLRALEAQPRPVSGGSTDVAELSWMVPTAGFSVATAASGVPWHSWATTACHGTSAGWKGAVVAAKVLAATGIDLLTRPELLESARIDFEKASGGATYRSPLPANQKPPVPPDLMDE